MKTIIFALLIIFLFAAANLSQIKIVPKKVVYKRETDVSYKKEFTVIRPKISGLANRKLARRIEANLSYEKTFDFFKEEGLNEQYHLLDEASYQVIYNKNNILNLNLIIDVSAAHESHYEKSVVVNTKTGERVKPEDIFIKAKFEELASEIDKLMQAEVKETLAEIEKDYDKETLEGVKTQFGEGHFPVDYLADFKISDKGVTFFYDYGFSHISRNFEPAGEFFLSYDELKPFIRHTGLLGKFIR